MSRSAPIHYLFCVLGTATLLAVGCAQQAGLGSAGPGSSTFEAADTPTTQVQRVSAKFRGKKVAVFPFINKALTQYRFLGNASSDYLLEMLQEAGFRTIEGATSPGMKRVMGELRFGLSDMVNNKTAVEAGQHLGTDFVFLGSVTDFNIVKGGGAKGISFRGIGIGGSSNSITYTVQSAGRFIDIKTREILAATTSTYRKKFKTSGGHIRTPWGNIGSTERVKVINETGGRILQLGLNRMMNKVVRRLNSL